jgi:DNA-binding MarR family transcriptional regulator
LLAPTTSQQGQKRLIDCHNRYVPDVALSPPDQSESVVDSVLLASRILVAVAARSLSDIAEEVTLTQFRTLVVLATEGPQSLAGLAEAVGVTPATTTRMCDRLVKRRLVHRQAEPGNRRHLRLVLTKKGLALVDAVTDRRRSEIQRIMSNMSPDDQSVLVQALRTFAQAAGEVPEQYWTTGWNL